MANYTAIDPAYGTLDDFDELVARAHERGIRIVLDRRQPDGVNTEGFQVVQPLRHAAQIAGAAAGRVLKTFWVNLIDDPVWCVVSTA